MCGHSGNAGELARSVFRILLVSLLVGTRGYAQSEMWKTRAPMPTPRCCGAAAAIGGALYAVGGGNSQISPTFYLSVLEAYDPLTDTWSVKAPMPTPRTGFGVSALNGELYVVGGGNFAIPYLASVEAYDPQTDSWTSKAPMPTPRSLLAVAVADGKLYAIGGSGEAGLLRIVEAYDPQTNTWSEKTPMPAPRRGFAATALSGIIYVVGGDDSSTPPDGRPRMVYAYDPQMDTWTTRASIPTGRDGLTAAAVGGTLYAIGGQNQFGYLATVEAYDPVADSWSTEPPMPTARNALASGALEDTIYAVGGVNFDPSTRATVFLAVNEAFSPFLMVGIDIKPGEARNTINLKSGGVVQVAILGSATFDPLTVDPETVTLAGASVATGGRGLPMTSARDANHDGYPDLVLFFRTQDLQLTPGSTEAVLYGTTFSGQRLRGADSVRIVPPAKPISAPGRSRAALARRAGGLR